MGMNAAQSAQPGRPGPVAWQRRDEDSPVVSDDNQGDVASPVYQQPNLPLDLERQFAEIAAQFQCHHPVARDSAPVDALNAMHFAGFQSENISVKFMDGLQTSCNCLQNLY